MNKMIKHEAPPTKWISTTIGEQITLQRGFDITVKEQRPGKIPVISSSGFSSFHDTVAVNGPGVVIGRKGTLGTVFYIDAGFWPHDTTLWVKDFHGNDPRFVFYFLKNLDVTQLNVGSANPTLNRNHVHPIQTLWPPLPEQRAIARILGSLDDKLELNRHMNETLVAIASGIFKSWFVDFDPVRAKAEGREPACMDAETAELFPDSFEETELGGMPRGWVIKALYDCAQYINGSVFSSEDFSANASGLPIIKIAELKDGITAQTKFTEIELDPDYQLSNGDILFSWSGSPETSIDIFVWAGGQGWLNQHIFKVVPYTYSSSESKYFVYFLLKHLKKAFIEIARDKQTTGLGHVTSRDLKEIRVVFPSESILRAFNAIAEPIFHLTLNDQLESYALKRIRDLLLPKLLSGELRVEGISVNEVP